MTSNQKENPDFIANSGLLGGLSYSNENSFAENKKNKASRAFKSNFFLENSETKENQEPTWIADKNTNSPSCFYQDFDYDSEKNDDEKVFIKTIIDLENMDDSSLFANFNFDISILILSFSLLIN